MRELSDFKDGRSLAKKRHLAQAQLPVSRTRQGDGLELYGGFDIDIVEREEGRSESQHTFLACLQSHLLFVDSERHV